MVTESSSVVASGSQGWGSVEDRREGSQKGKSKPWGVTSRFITLIMVMLSHVCVYVKNLSTVHLKYGQFAVRQLCLRNVGGGHLSHVR